MQQRIAVEQVHVGLAVDVRGPALPGLCHHKASDGASSEARQREHGLIAAPVADPSVWFVRELLHCCRGRR